MVVTRLNREITAILASQESKNAMMQQGVDAETSTPEVLGPELPWKSTNGAC